MMTIIMMIFSCWCATRGKLDGFDFNLMKKTGLRGSRMTQKVKITQDRVIYKIYI